MVLALPASELEKMFKKPDVFSLEGYTLAQSLTLTDAQQQASWKIQDSLGSFQAFVLDGVTGSGKTEVYLDALEPILKNQGQALVLLPEIALTTQWLERFKRRFKREPDLWHSGISLKIKRLTWQKILAGGSGIVVGARSALFLPFQNLQLIVVDEEHDDSYKQQEQSHYHARDMAVVRARLSNVPIVLSSATPSLETVYNIQKGKYQNLELTERFADALFPTVDIVDMRQQPRQTWISAPLKQALQNCLESNHQALLFLNRRGYAPLTLCRSCGYRFMCPACDIWLVHHKQKRGEHLRCHHCGFQQSLPNLCPECHQPDSMIACGPGVERVSEEINQLFPSARVLIATSDHLVQAQSMEQMVDRIQKREIDIIIGTQVLAKGHHFPFLTVVGIIDADLSLNGGDLRASERTYQVLHQVSGRAGREKHKGKVLLQTYHPDHPLFQALQQNRRDDFYACELSQRQSQHFPPLGYLAAVLITGFNPQVLEKFVSTCARLAPSSNDVTVLGPIPAPVARLKGRHRWRFLLKAERPLRLQAFLKDWLNHPQIRQTQGALRLTIDIDPYTFL